MRNGSRTNGPVQYDLYTKVLRMKVVKVCFSNEIQTVITVAVVLFLKVKTDSIFFFQKLVISLSNISINFKHSSVKDVMGLGVLYVIRECPGECFKAYCT